MTDGNLLKQTRRRINDTLGDGVYDASNATKPVVLNERFRSCH
ncbi:hypothetical protein [Candidatus Enterovibrio altilux]|nr:hypothetical protein [Candidatus Enterovibrio luxaltus]